MFWGYILFFFSPWKWGRCARTWISIEKNQHADPSIPMRGLTHCFLQMQKNGAEVLNSREHKPSSCKPFSSSDTGKEGKFPSSKVTVRSGGLWALMQTNHHITGIPKYFTIILPPAGISKYMPLETLKKKNNQTSLAIWCNKAIPDWYVSRIKIASAKMANALRFVRNWMHCTKQVIITTSDQWSRQSFPLLSCSLPMWTVSNNN